MKKETTIAVLSTIVAVFVILMIIGLISNKQEKDSMVSVPIEITSTQFKDSFIEGCMEGDSSYTLCSCAYTQLENKYGNDGLLDLAADYLKTEKLPEEAIDAILVCVE